MKMTAEQKLVLFSRPDCHLCDVAAHLLRELGLVFEVRNIESDLSLISRYGVRIPVLSRGGAGVTLDWPFTQAQVVEYLELDQQP
jgi:hypothetical protein